RRGQRGQGTARGGRRPFGHCRCGVRAARRKGNRSGGGAVLPCRLPRRVPDGRSRDPRRARQQAQGRRIGCRRRGGAAAGKLRSRRTRLGRDRRVRHARRDAGAPERPALMTTDGRRIAVALAGFCAFVNLYMPQALLPVLAREFGVGAAEISQIITASTLAIALTAPFTGAAADVLGRKRVMTVAMIALIVPTVMVALAPNVPTLIV